VFGARLTSSDGYSPRCTGRRLKAGRRLSLLWPLPSLSTEPGWLTGALTGAGGWSMRLAGPRSSGLGHISPTFMPTSGATQVADHIVGRRAVIKTSLGRWPARQFRMRPGCSRLAPSGDQPASRMFSRRPSRRWRRPL